MIETYDWNSVDHMKDLETKAIRALQSKALVLEMLKKENPDENSLTLLTFKA